MSSFRGLWLSVVLEPNSAVGLLATELPSKGEPWGLGLQKAVNLVGCHCDRKCFPAFGLRMSVFPNALLL